MGWVSRLHGRAVGLDTAPLIFYIEENPDYIDLVDAFFDDLIEGKFEVVTSTITLLEVLVHPIRNADEALAGQYNDILLSSPHMTTLPVSFATAETAVELRAQHNLKTPDAIQLATALNAGAEFFLTNDRDFPEIAELEVLKLRELTA